ncbi:hypothetical protein [Dyadobacter sandarakinus]|uniref:Uncharacterized protein n=1 Tax=Dyadobacter sandarakinus TaxID=2747268 RepID=A0ABX7I548_9BACT|nr:hypothetical protein [Dyadobacter sandarakinus]QRR00612.1 hypothetical protein HWI92_06670 [Dyadobacter sandarakinus]
MFYIIEMTVHASFTDRRSYGETQGGQDTTEPDPDALRALEDRITESVVRKVMSTIERQKER